MNLVENIKEGLRSIRANMLRSGITMVIVVLGIMALVGILTAVSAVEKSIHDSMASLGVNTFDIRSKADREFNQGGVSERNYPPLTLTEAFQFLDRYSVPASISLAARVSDIAEVKRLSEKTNPNVGVLGVNEEYMAVKGLLIDKGRNFSMLEVKSGGHTAILGSQVYKAVFKDEKEDPIGEVVSFMGTQFRVIGVMQEKGQLSEDNYDNMVLIPIVKGNQMAHGRGLNYDLTVGVNNPAAFDHAMGEATGLMRIIRHDKIGAENSFEIEKSETLNEKLDSMLLVVRVAGIVIAFLTLLGASIALVNIMLVSVTERTREIGLRKALGATPLRIRQQFIIEAIVLCLLGGVGGIILGIVGGNIVARILSIDEFTIPWVLMLEGLAVCVCVGLVSGYYPARKASKLDPIESIRFE